MNGKGMLWGIPKQLCVLCGAGGLREGGNNVNNRNGALMVISSHSPFGFRTSHCVYALTPFRISRKEG